MQYLSILASLAIGYLAIGLIFVIFMIAHEEKLFRYMDTEKLPDDVALHLQNAPSITKTIFLWPKTMMWLTKLEDLLKKPPL